MLLSILILRLIYGKRIRMNKILDKIKNVPIGVKSAAVYTLASVFSKGLAIITVPIFTSIMSTSEIGVDNINNKRN